jgi:cytosine/adenosine deaminase-related metal-dependent hydrolase
MWHKPKYLYTPEGWQTDLAIEFDESGMLTDMGALPAGEMPVEYDGYLVPGFVNAHCHLELSALKGKVPEHTGMAGFVSNLLPARAAIDDQEAKKAIAAAMDAAWESGTVAIGDICNNDLSVEAKKKNPQLYTHSFIELLGLDESKAELIIGRGKELATQFESLPHSLTPHAPYSVSNVLRDVLYEEAEDVLSIHLLESQEETRLFKGQGGPLWYFLKQIPLSHPLHIPLADPMHHILKGLSSQQKILLVHMVEASSTQLAALTSQFPNAYVCICPRANHYIHRSLPDLEAMLRIMPDRICLGTDSLAGNHSLDMQDEIDFLRKHFPNISLHTLVKIATTQGAEALGVEEMFGAFVPGTTPGMVYLGKDQ